MFYMLLLDSSKLKGLMMFLSLWIFSGIMYSILVTGVITDAIKDGVGRPRPDFFWRCFPDGVAVSHIAILNFVPSMLLSTLYN